MGNTYEVSVWRKVSTEEEQHAYVWVWRGESRRTALKVMDEYAQRYECVKLEYRP